MTASGAPTRLATMHPAYFALVMATGIVSLACQLVGLPTVARALFWLNPTLYVGLCALFILRLVRHRERVVEDLLSHGRSVGFFTIVAATSVLGSQCLLVGGAPGLALGLWIAAIVMWAACTYGVITVLTVKPDKPALADGINGGWLVTVVAAQSVAVLGAQLSPRFAAPALPLLFCLLMWLGGAMLYLWIISLIFFRYTFFVMSPSDLAPPYWINMGAAAITTLGGTALVAAAPGSPVITQVLPFVRGFTLLWWATASWWIPMLLVLGAWRHVYRRFPFRYDPLYWGAVFPLGMYTVCTGRLSQAVDAPYLFAISRVFVHVALGAWLVVAVAMLASLLRRPAPQA